MTSDMPHERAHRASYNPKVPCACGGLKTPKSPHCRACSDRVRREAKAYHGQPKAAHAKHEFDDSLSKRMLRVSLRVSA